MNTLADMTEEERTNCIGMWCYIFERLNEPPIYEGIIAGYRESAATLTTAEVFNNAPEGTIVEDITDPRCVAMKIRGIWYLAGLGGAALTSEGMPACRVIRWGGQ